MTMKALIIGYGQDAIILSNIFCNRRVEHLILARKTKKTLDKINCFKTSNSRIHLVSEINIHELKTVKEHFAFIL